MGHHYLNQLFSPKSIAVFGASESPDSVGTLVFKNLLDAGFKGSLYPINPKHAKVQELECFPNLTALDKPVELAVIATPANTVPSIIQQCGEHNVKGAIIISSGFSEAGIKGQRLQKDMVEIAQQYGVHIIGPNCMGVMRPAAGLNATYSRSTAKPGNLALVSQSGGMCTAILDWAAARQIGFSSVVTLGDTADVDFGDVLEIGRAHV